MKNWILLPSAVLLAALTSIALALVRGERGDAREAAAPAVDATALAKLQLVDVAEAVGAVDEAGIRAGGDAPAHFLVIVHQPEPHLIKIPPRDFIVRGPVIPVGAVVRAARLVEIPQRRQRVLLVPLRHARAHQVAPRRINRQRRVEHRAQREMLLQVRLPLRPARLVNFVPQPRHLPEAVLLVVVEEVHRPRLYHRIFQQRFEMPVEVRHRAQPGARGLDGVHLRDAGLLQVGRRA